MKKVREFFNKENLKNQLKLVRPDGDTVYYNAAQNEYGVVSVDGYVRRLFRPEEGAKYFWRELVKYQ